MRNQKLQGTAYEKRRQRRIYKRSDQPKKVWRQTVDCNRQTINCKADTTIRSLVDPTLAAFIVCGPLQFLVSHLCIFGPYVFQIRYAKFLKHGGCHAVQCLGWPCPATFIFCLSRHQSWHFVSLRPETRDVARHVSGRKWVQSTELDIVNGSFCNLCALAIGLALPILVTQCWRVPRGTK